MRRGDRFGWLAVFGRQPSPAEQRRMLTVEAVINAYDDRARAENWVTWANDNPDLNRVLNQALKAAANGE